MNTYVRFLDDIPMFDIEMACIKTFAVNKKIPIDAQSPLHSLTAFDTTKHDGIEDDEKMLVLTTVLCRPRMVSNFSKAGMGEPNETFTVYGAYVGGKPYFAFIQPVEMQKRILLFDQIEELSTYIVSRFGTMHTGRGQQIEPFETDINHFIFLLNVIDTIKRRYLSGLLSGKHVSEDYLTLKAYQEELDFSLKNSDVRWLLPSALRLIPKFHQFKMEFDPEKFDLNFPFGLVSKYQSAEEHDLQFFLSDAIKKMGLSFTHHWKYAIGFDLKRLDIGDSVKRYYLAPTNEINHIFELDEPLEKGLCRYSALAFDELILKLERIFRDGLG